MNTDTPLPPDEPGSENPPDGAVIDYYLGASSSGPVILEIRDAAGQIVRRYSSADPIPEIDPMLAIPPYWVRPEKGLPAGQGMHRFLWDMHYAPVPGEKPSYPIAAVYKNTAPDFTSPWVMPGKYSVVLKVNGQSYSQPLTVQMDPRVKTPVRDLAEQFRLSQQLYEQWLSFDVLTAQVTAIRKQLSEVRAGATTNDLKSHIDALNLKLDALVGPESRRPDPASKLTTQSATARLRTLFGILQDVDLAPTPQAIVAIAELQKDAQLLLGQWRAIQQDVAALNKELQATGLPAIKG